MQSTRLPGKVLLDFGGRTVLENVVRRAQRSKVANAIVATSPDVADDPISDFCIAKGIPVVRAAAQDDVFRRFLFVLAEYPCDYFLRLTADCPLIEPKVLDAIMETAQMILPQFIAATVADGMADGLDCEVIRTDAFQRINPSELSGQELEHCTMALPRYMYRVPMPGLAAYRSLQRLTLDTHADYLRLLDLVGRYGNDLDTAMLLAALSCAVNPISENTPK